MRMLNLLLIILTGFFICSVSQGAVVGWDYAGNGIKEPSAKIVFVDESDTNIIYVATDNFLYMSEDKGKTYREIFMTPGKENKINFAAVINNKLPSIFVATQDGLYKSEDYGKHWKAVSI